MRNPCFEKPVCPCLHHKIACCENLSQHIAFHSCSFNTSDCLCNKCVQEHSLQYVFGTNSLLSNHKSKIIDSMITTVLRSKPQHRLIQRKSVHAPWVYWSFQEVLISSEIRSNKNRIPLWMFKVFPGARLTAVLWRVQHDDLRSCLYCILGYMVCQRSRNSR